jgi:hypothetical protein
MAAASERPCDPSPLSPEATERRVRHLTLIITCAMAVGAGLVWEAGVGAGGRCWRRTGLPELCVDAGEPAIHRGDGRRR